MSDPYGGMNRQQWKAYLAYMAARQTGRGLQSYGRLSGRMSRGFFRICIRWVLDGRIRRHRWMR
jgi:hypothetical protein